MGTIDVHVFLPAAVTILVVIAAAVVDSTRRRLPNWLTLGGAAVGLGLNLALYGLEGGVGSITGWLLGCALLFAPFLLGGLGAGDVKLLAAVGALKGASFVFMAFLYSALAGGLLAVALMLYRGELLPVLGRMGGGFARAIGNLVRYRNLPLGESLLAAAGGVSTVGPVAKAGRRATLPYGVAIAAGSLIALALGH